MTSVDRLLGFTLVRSAARAQALARSTSAFAASIGVRIRPSEATMQPNPTPVAGIENGSNAVGRVEFVIVTTAGLTAEATRSIEVADDVSDWLRDVRVARSAGVDESRVALPRNEGDDERRRSYGSKACGADADDGDKDGGPRCSQRRELVRDALGDGVASPTEAAPSEGGTVCSRQEWPMPRRA